VFQKYRKGHTALRELDLFLSSGKVLGGDTAAELGQKELFLALDFYLRTDTCQDPVVF
jgi:hypothetical protein